jgi:RNA polymerase sigma-70 factor (ECF subfamily)
VTLTGALPLAPTGADAAAGAEAEAARPASFDAIYETYFDFVWRNVRRLGVPDALVDDAVQDVFIFVHRRRSDFVHGSFRAWLFAVLANVARDHRRTHRRKSTVLRGTVPPVDPDEVACAAMPSADEAVARVEGVALLHALLDQLDDEKRAAFVLAELEQMTIPDIALATGVNTNTVYARLRAARRELEICAARMRARDEWRLR